MCIDKPESDPLILTLPNTRWDQNAEDNTGAIEALEQGKVLFLPHLTFELSEQEKQLLDPTLVDVKRKNISFKPLEGVLTGVTDASKIALTRQLLDRYYQSCLSLVQQLLPVYTHALHSPTNSLRLHPVAAWRDSTSWRKDDSRLHVDAFRHAQTTVSVSSAYSPILTRMVKRVPGVSVKILHNLPAAICHNWIAIHRSAVGCNIKSVSPSAPVAITTI